MSINKVNREVLFNVVKEKINHAEIVGDIGCGIRPQDFIEPRYHICIDPHNQYLEFVKNKIDINKNYSFINADWTEAVKIFPENSFDTIFLLDVIEHIEKDIALKLLEETKRIITNQIVVFTPLGFIEQHHVNDKDAWGLDGGKWQEHKSGWLPEDFGEGWDFYICEDFHTHDNLGKKYEKPQGAFFAIFNSQKEIKKNKPIFTVVVPTYNQAQFLGDALDSLINQSFPFWEAIIVNDGSTDDTKEVIDKYLSIDKRFRAYHKENGGVASALNEGIKHAKGEWICWLSSDDLFQPDKLEIHYKEILNNPAIKFFHSHWYLLIDETKQKIAPPLWLAIPPTEFQVTRFFWANYIHGNAIAVHRSVFDEVGLFNEALRQGQDFDMWLRISSKFVSHYIDKRTCITRIHKGQTTNSFVEGGILDSTRALIQFLNEKGFKDLFPFTDFSDPNNIFKVLNEILYISTKEDAFLYRCGFTSALAEKTMEWFTNEVSPQVFDKVFSILKNIAIKYIEQPLTHEIKEVLKIFLNRKKITFKKHDFIADTQQFIKQLLIKGDQRQAKAIETYLIRILKNENMNEVSYEKFLFNYPKDKLFEKIEPVQIKHWTVEPGRVDNNSIKHVIKIECNKCNYLFNIILEYEMINKTTTQEFICPHCKTGYRFNDENFDKDFISFHHNKVKINDDLNEDSCKVAFFIKDASVVGGGTKILFKYIDWLIKLGLTVSIYSFAKKPDWIDIKLKYIQIQSESEIKTNYKLLFVFSIFDVPFVLNKIPISKVVHICQGYEGYHFGRDYNELRSDKHILTKLHELPVKNICISNHLVDLFEDKFNREPFYIPNGINHKVFSFSSDTREKSILFIGNPFHSLKGFEYLASGIKNIQYSNSRIEKLKLIIVMGFKPENLENIIKHIEKQLNCTVEFKTKLRSEEVACLMKKAGVVVCSSWYEGFSIPLLEAMASGTPVITTNNLGAQSFCKEGYNSFNIDYGNVKKLSSLIVGILNSSIKTKELIKNAYKTSLEYTESNSVNNFINVFEKLLNIEFEKNKKESLVNEYQYDESILNNELLNEVKKENSLISIVIPVYNQINYTIKCIESITNATKNNVELIIIDNASNDNTSEILSSFKETKINLKVIRNEDNLGFPKAVNQGVVNSSGKYILIANNDIVFTNNSIDRMIEIAESDQMIGIVGPISNEVSGPQKDYNANYKSIEEMFKYAKEVLEKNKGQVLQFPRVAFLCTLVKREVIEKIGGLDERFSPGNYEDDDFCLRSQLAGFKTVISKDVFIHHYGSKSFKANGLNEYQKRLDANRDKFVEKWNATPEEIWLENKKIKQHQIYYPIDNDLFQQYLKRARIHLADNELLLAEESIVKAIENYKEDSTLIISLDELYNLAGNISLALKEFHSAQNYFEQELQINPQSSTACFGLGQVFITTENYEAAKTMLEWAIKNDESNLRAKETLQNVNEILGLDINHNSLVEM